MYVPPAKNSHANTLFFGSSTPSFLAVRREEEMNWNFEVKALKHDRMQIKHMQSGR